MTDTVETLRADLDALRLEFNTFLAYAKPTIDGHQPLTEVIMDAQKRFDGRGPSLPIPTPPPGG